MTDAAPTLPPTERLIMELLVEAGPSFGLRLVELSSGRLKRGTVYVTLGRMEAKGFLSSEQEEPPAGAIGLPRRRYQPTPLGLRALRAWGLYLQELQLEVQS